MNANRIRLSNFARLTLLAIQTLTEDTLEFTLKELEQYVDVANSSLGKSVNELEQGGYIKRLSTKVIKVVEKLRYPRYMTLDLQKKTIKFLSKLDSALDIVDDIHNLKRVALETDFEVQTIRGHYKDIIKAGYEVDMSLFDEVPYECKNLSTICVEKEVVVPIVKGPVDSSTADNFNLIFRALSVMFDEWAANGGLYTPGSLKIAKELRERHI